MVKNYSSAELVTLNNSDESANLEILLKRKYKKSNFLIGAKYQSRLLENQILAISLADADNFYKDDKGIIVSATKAEDIITLLGKNKGSFYQTLDRAGERLTNRKIGMKDPEHQSFDYVDFIIRARLEDGVFYIHYSPYFEEYLSDIKKNYTELNLKIMLKFKTVYSFRLYELIKSQCYYVNKAPNLDYTYHINFSLGELMLELGAINAEDSDIKSKLYHKDNPDYNLVVGIDEDKKITWGNFKKALDKAINEINSVDEIRMHLEYDTVKTGKGGRVSRVIFTAEVSKELLNEDQLAEIHEEKELTLEEQEDFLDALGELIEERLRLKELRAIAEAANFNMDIIAEKYEISQTQNVNNLVGWMIKAIKDDYSTPVSISPKTTKKNKKQWEIEEHDYDFAEFEKVLRDN